MDKDTKDELEKLLIRSMKELGEICECIVKGDDVNHWKAELSDLCGLGIFPMLKLADMDFMYAVEIGISRKQKKLKRNKVN